MAFNISYIFTARDKYTAVARKVVLANDKINRSADAAAKKSKELQTNLRGIAVSARTMRNVGLGMTAGITLPFLLASRSAAKAASDAQESSDKFNTIFRSMASESSIAASELAKNYGLASSTSKELLGDTADLLTGFGFTVEKALEVSVVTNQLAIDLASFTNFSGGAAGASSALTRAFTGEREALKALGVVITEDLVTQKIRTMLSEGAAFGSLQEAKALATLAIATEQSKNALGDYARTQDQSANIERRRIETIKSLKEAFGGLLLPIQDKINQSIITMSNRLMSLSPETQKVILVVGGLVAVLGPVLLIIGAIGLALPALITGFVAMGTAIAFMSGPIGIIITLGTVMAAFLLRFKIVRRAIGGLVSGIVAAFKFMGSIIGSVFSKLFGFITPLMSVFEKIKGFVASLGIGDVSNINQTNIAAASPTVSTINSQATINGQINVSASPGSQVDSVESNNIFGGAIGNVGLGVTG